MAVFPLLADEANYRACDHDLLIDPAARSYWLDLFASHLGLHMGAADLLEIPREALIRADSALKREMDLIRARPDRHGRLDILLLTDIYRAALAAEGITDEFRLIKQRENEAALAALARRIAELDRLDDGPRFEALIRGMLAGNLFDMGVEETARRFADRSLPFAEALDSLPDRPWFVDDLDELRQGWLASTPPKTIIFADNAGADIVLGILPLARELLRRGGGVVIAANETPALNDVTSREVKTVINRASEIDPIWRDGKLTVVSSGCKAPLIDLTSVSEELARAARGADLVILDGMGRAVESNYHARFACNVWRVAMLKDPQVARSVGGEMYDAIFRASLP
ncbi:MAG: DUF89 family protein [Phycisphaerales bacterium]|nr:MAG: DUF89 family protein [Phycisphaerales bacterium]